MRYRENHSNRQEEARVRPPHCPDNGQPCRGRQHPVYPHFRREGYFRAGRRRLVQHHLYVVAVLCSTCPIESTCLDSENDVEKLIEKLETQDSEPAQPTGAAMSFSFAKIWERDRNTLEEVPEEAMADDAQDFWEGVLARSRLEQQAREAKQQTGRGVRRNATKSVSNRIFENPSLESHGALRSGIYC